MSKARDRAYRIARRNQKYKRRLEIDAVNKSKRTLQDIKRDFIKLLGTPEKTLERIDNFDFSTKYGNLIANQAMKAYVLGYYEVFRRRQGKALFAITYENVAERETWGEIFYLMQDKIPMEVEEFYALDAHLRNKYWTVARTENVRMIDTVKKLIGSEIAKGETGTDFIEKATEWYASAGLDPLSPSHLAQVYRTNQGIAYEAAHEEFLLNNGFGDEQLMWITAGDDNVRPEHEALEGVVETVVFWSNSGLWAPVGFQCRCSMGDVPATMRGRDFDPAMLAGLETTSDYKDFALSPAQMLRAA